MYYTILFRRPKINTEEVIETEVQKYKMGSFNISLKEIISLNRFSEIINIICNIITNFIDSNANTTFKPLSKTRTPS